MEGWRSVRVWIPLRSRCLGCRKAYGPGARFCGCCGERLMVAEELFVMGVRDEGRSGRSAAEAGAGADKKLLDS